MIALSSVNSGPPKSPGLLAGDDRDGLRIAKPRRCGQRLRRRAAPLLLRLHDAGNRLARARVLLASGNCLPPRARVARIAREEIGDLRVVERVVGDQRPDPREPADIDGDA